MNTQNQRIAKMTYSSVYPVYAAKVEKKGRIKDELHQGSSRIWLGKISLNERIKIK